MYPSNIALPILPIYQLHSSLVGNLNIDSVAFSGKSKLNRRVFKRNNILEVACDHGLENWNKPKYGVKWSTELLKQWEIQTLFISTLSSNDCTIKFCTTYLFPILEQLKFSLLQLIALNWMYIFLFEH